MKNHMEKSVKQRGAKSEENIKPLIEYIHTFNESTIAPNFANALTAPARTVAFSRTTRLYI